MPEDSSHFKVIAMPGWERDLRKVIRGRPAVADAVQELLVILRRDPHRIQNGRRPMANPLEGIPAAI